MSVDVGVIQQFLAPPLPLMVIQLVGSFDGSSPPGPYEQPNSFGFAWEVTSWPAGYGAIEIDGQRRFWRPVFRWTYTPATLTSILGGKQLHGDLVDEHEAEGLRMFPSPLAHRFALQLAPGITLDLYSIKLL